MCVNSSFIMLAPFSRKFEHRPPHTLAQANEIGSLALPLFDDTVLVNTDRNTNM